MSVAHGAPRAPEVIERFLKALIVANKAVGLYPGSSEIPRQSAQAVIEILHEVLRERAELVLDVRKDGLVFEDAIALATRASSTSFAIDLYNRRVAEIRFHIGATADDVLGFLSVLCHTPAELDNSGGFATRLWELGVTGISVVEVRVTVVDADAFVGVGDQESPLTRVDIERALDPSTSHNRRDVILVARFFGDSHALADYLSGLYVETGSAQEVAARFAMLADKAGAVTDIEAAAPKNLADALSHIDEVLRSDLLMEEVLPEARGNAAVADVLRQIDVENLFAMLFAGIDPENPPVDALARAVRQAMALYANNPGDMVSAAGAAMRAAGFAQDAVDEILAKATPSMVTVTEDQSHAEAVAGQGSDAAIATAVQHEYTPLSDEEIAALPEIDELREEAERGVTYGDIALVLIGLVANDVDDEKFDTTMSALESSLTLAVERTEIDAAAEAAEALGAASKDPRFSAEQRERLEKALVTLARPADVRSIVARLKSHSVGSKEREAAQRLLDLLGPRAVDPLLEQLANEQDMAARKSLIDVLSGIAPRHVQDVGRHVADERWFVVRNVVAILGATHSSAAIPYLERTMRHADARVRRETIRALSGINDRFANQVLSSALTDDDAQNVQLAARYLGSARVDMAIPALERVARGEGYGNRELGSRIEAIEALGRMGSRSALPTLQTLASRRSLLQAKQTREIRTAATAAVERIKMTTGGVS